MIGVQSIKYHKSDSSALLMHVWHGMDQSVIDVFAHVCEQTLDNLSNCCDNKNSHMNETFILYKCDASFNFIWQFYDKFQLLNFQS